MHDLMAKGRNYGMQTFDQDLLSKLRGNLITRDVAMSAASSPGDLDLQLRLGLDGDEMEVERHNVGDVDADDALLEFDVHTLDSEAAGDPDKPEGRRSA